MINITLHDGDLQEPQEKRSKGSCMCVLMHTFMCVCVSEPPVPVWVHLLRVMQTALNKWVWTEDTNPAGHGTAKPLLRHGNSVLGNEMETINKYISGYWIKLRLLSLPSCPLQKGWWCDYIKFWFICATIFTIQLILEQLYIEGPDIFSQGKVPFRSSLRRKTNSK